MKTKTLRSRLEVLEKSLSAMERACEQTIQSALRSISHENLELLIDATLAPLRGRELTEREAGAKQAYASALERECRMQRITVRRTPRAKDMINDAAMRRMCEDDLALAYRGYCAMQRGFKPNAAEAVAIKLHLSMQTAQYQRAGFSSCAEFDTWFAKETGQ